MASWNTPHARGVDQQPDRNYGSSLRPSRVLAAAREAEALSFDGIWVHDAPLGRRVMASDSPPILAAIAAQTTTLKLCTGILVPHLQDHFNPDGAITAQCLASAGRSADAADHPGHGREGAASGAKRAGAKSSCAARR